MLKTRFALVAVALYSGIFVEQSIASPLTSAEVTKIINRVSVIEPAKGDRPAALRDVIKEDRKSTRLNSSHDQISYAVFCLKKKKPPHPFSHSNKKLKPQYTQLRYHRCCGNAMVRLHTARKPWLWTFAVTP